MGPAAGHDHELRALREAHATLTRILGAIEEYVYTGEFLPGGAYRLVFAGPCREQFLGLSVEEARTAVWRHYVHPDDVATFDEAHASAMSGARLDVEYRLIGADGVLRWVRDRGRMRVEDGRCFLDGSILDVTEVRTTQEELRAARAEADRLAHVDHLTGAANRRSLAQVLAAAADEPLGLLLVDLDHFKQVNDRHGHAAGDAVLVAIAGRLRAAVRQTDTVVRMGGEEFLLVLRGIGDDEALRRAAEHVRRRIEQDPVQAADHRLVITVSIGAALVPGGTSDADPLLSGADAALYEAKRQGRNRVRLAGDAAGREPARPEDHESLRVARAMAVVAAAAGGRPVAQLEDDAALAAGIAARLARPPGEVLRCRIAALVRDVALPHAGAEGHAAAGAGLLEQVPELRGLAGVVEAHHDATGPPEARIVAAVDAWRLARADAGEAVALARLRRRAGATLDPAVVDALAAEVGARSRGARAGALAA